MEDQEIYYGIGTIINDPEDWKKFAEVSNSVLPEGESPLETEWAGDAETLPGFVAIGKISRKELEEITKSPQQTANVWPEIEKMLEVVDAGYPICMFKL